MMTSQTTQKRRLGILICGHSPDAVVDAFGRYDKAFAKLLGPNTYEYKPYFPVDNEFPASVEEADAWLLTGSKHGVYDDLPWIAPLEAFVREIYAAHLPMVGICFGHQLMAQALGGQVEKYSGGWIAGTQCYQFNDNTSLNNVVLNAWHQDQITKKPENARVLASSDECQYAVLEYRSNTVSLQPHPEFDNDYLQLLLKHRGESLPQPIRQFAQDALGQDLQQKAIADWLNRVLGPSG